MSGVVRHATDDELELLPAIETAADDVFAAVGITGLPPAADVGELRQAAAVLVVGDPPIGFARLELVDGHAHLEQLSVHPAAMRHGHGRRLLDATIGWARARGDAEITLITFRDVPWNAPFYAASGFVVMDELSSGLAALRAHERDVLGMDALGARVVMRRDLR